MWAQKTKLYISVLCHHCLPSYQTHSMASRGGGGGLTNVVDPDPLGFRTIVPDPAEIEREDKLKLNL